MRAKILAILHGNNNKSFYLLPVLCFVELGEEAGDGFVGAGGDLFAVEFFEVGHEVWGLGSGLVECGSDCAVVLSKNRVGFSGG